MSGLLLRASGVSKTFATGRSRASGLFRVLRGKGASGGRPAVDDVSLDLSQGDCLGVVGRNGAGKSTLLSILCGISEPDGGHVERSGRIAPMLELGAGFRPDFTGRENVLINAALHGMDASTARERLDAIRDFSGIAGYFDRPVREYSSGMRARLAFSVAAHVDADILVVDELLGVGDAAFQQKGRRFMRQFLERGAVIVVSHDDNLLLSACTRAVWLEKGRAVASGNTADVLRRYRASFLVEAGDPQPVLPPDDEHTTHDDAHGSNPIRISHFRPEAPSHGLGAVSIDAVFFETEDSVLLSSMQGTDTVVLVIRGIALRDAENLIAGFIIRDENGQNLLGDNSFETYRLAPRTLKRGQRFEARFRFRMPYLPRGTYFVTPSVISGTQADHVHQCWIEEAVILDVASSPVVFGKVGVACGGTITVEPA